MQRSMTKKRTLNLVRAYITICIVRLVFIENFDLIFFKTMLVLDIQDCFAILPLRRWDSFWIIAWRLFLELYVLQDDVGQPSWDVLQFRSSVDLWVRGILSFKKSTQVLLMRAESKGYVLYWWLHGTTLLGPQLKYPSQTLVTAQI